MVQFQLDAVQDVENSQSNSKGSGILQKSNRVFNRTTDPNLLRAERMSKFSKTSIQMTKF